MIIEDQSAAIECLAAPATHGGRPVERIETHASIVFLAGTRAWKLKRAVRYDYLDFSTAERRQAMCDAEVRVNRRTAPSLYRGVVAVVRRPDGSLALGGPGVPIEWVVEMNRFGQEALFDRLSGRHALGLELMLPLASAVAQFHLAAERLPDHGGRSGMAWVVDGDARGFAEEGGEVFDPALATSLTHDSHAALDRHAAQLDRRRETGFVRRCHGDLHLRNIVLLEGPEQILVKRLRRRQADPSDADRAVLRAQLVQGAGTITWDAVQASAEADDVEQYATAVVDKRLRAQVLRTPSENTPPAPFSSPKPVGR